MILLSSPNRDSNPDLGFRRALLYPLSYWGKRENYSIGRTLKRKTTWSAYESFYWIVLDKEEGLIQAARCDCFLDFTNCRGDLDVSRTGQCAVKYCMAAVNSELVVKDFQPFG